ncbi:MAG: hypothetical protein GF309_01755 [Candidatus Lokiarchaeota archaeon]|nr:hypothetical protein [Candidatus Lokiarchaeota archaeon]
MPDEEYDKYKHKYSDKKVRYAREYFAEDGEKPLSRREAVDALEKAGVKGLEEDEYYPIE